MYMCSIWIFNLVLHLHVHVHVCTCSHWLFGNRKWPVAKGEPHCVIMPPKISSVILKWRLFLFSVTQESNNDIIVKSILLCAPDIILFQRHEEQMWWNFRQASGAPVKQTHTLTWHSIWMWFAPHTLMFTSNLLIGSKLNSVNVLKRD